MIQFQNGRLDFLDQGVGLDLVGRERIGRCIGSGDGVLDGTVGGGVLTEARPDGGATTVECSRIRDPGANTVVLDGGRVDDDRVGVVEARPLVHHCRRIVGPDTIVFGGIGEQLLVAWPQHHEAVGFGPDGVFVERIGSLGIGGEGGEKDDRCCEQHGGFLRGWWLCC